MTPEQIRAERLRRLRIFAGRVPGQAITFEEWVELGGNDPDKRPLTQDPIGAHPHPKTGSPE